MTSPTILVVDSDVSFGAYAVDVCREAGYVGVAARCAPDAMEILVHLRYSLVLIGVSLPEAPSMQLLEYVTQTFPDTAVMMVGPLQSAELSDRAMRAGACDYLVKPVEREKLSARLTRALERRETMRELGRLREQLLRRTGHVV